MLPISPIDSISVDTRIFMFMFDDRNRSGLNILSNLKIFIKGKLIESIVASNKLAITMKKSS